MWLPILIGLVAAALIANEGGVTDTLAGGFNMLTWHQRMYEAISIQLPQLPVKSRLMILAHASFESGNGSGRAALRGFNVFNITAGSQWKGPKWTDVKGDSDGAGKRIDQSWRIYDSLTAAVADYWDFLGPNQNGGRYVRARAALAAGDMTGFVTELSKAGYFAADPGVYLVGMNAVFKSVSNKVNA